MRAVLALLGLDQCVKVEALLREESVLDLASQAHLGQGQVERTRAVKAEGGEWGEGEKEGKIGWQGKKKE